MLLATVSALFLGAGAYGVTCVVPAYIYPSGDGITAWNRIIESSKVIPLVAIFNPDSGPGSTPDSNDQAIVEKASKAGLRLISYVHTSYGARALTAVEADVTKYLRFYPKAATGFFVDEQSDSGSAVGYYRDLAVFIRDAVPRATIYSNPGTPCAEAYLTENTADVFLVHETGGIAGNLDLPQWVRKYPASRFAAVSYNVPTVRGMQDSLAAMATQHVGNVYVSDLNLPNPYNALPSYWSEEVSAIQRADGL